MSHRSDLVDLTLVYFRDTDKAILVADTEDSTKVWLPKSEIEYEFDADHAGVVDVTLPEWLAKDKGLI